MKKVSAITLIIVLSISAGCNTSGQNKELLTVDFQQGKTLRYEFLTNRSIYVDWGTSKNTAKPPIKDKPAEYTDFMQVVIAYKPIEVNPYGLSVIEGTCESARANKTKRAGRESNKTDAVTSLAGKTFKFTVGPNGEIADYSELDKTVRAAGEKAFRPRGPAGTIKEPDLLSDFIATQWFLWDPVSSIKNPAKGVAVGQSWESQTAIPLPMVLKAARDVKYTLTEIRQTDKGRLAVIKSDYSLAKTISRDWPLPYPEGIFQMSGPFGFFRNYKLLELQGQGEELFNIDAGRTEEYEQNYKLKAEAGLPMALNIAPQIYIEQVLRMKLLEDNKPKP